MATGLVTLVDENVSAVVKRAETRRVRLTHQKTACETRPTLGCVWGIRLLICHHGLLQDFITVKRRSAAGLGSDPRLPLFSPGALQPPRPQGRRAKTSARSG